MNSTDETVEPQIVISDEEIANYEADGETTCTLCFAEFLDPDDLKIHLNQVHKISSTVLKRCQLCPEEYTDMMQYAEHIRDVHLPSLKCCIYCWRIFDDFDAHRHHSKRHITKADSVYSCSQCKQKYSDLFSLKKHEFEHKVCSEGVMMYDVFPYLSSALKTQAVTFIESLGTDVVYNCAGCKFSTVDMVQYIRHASSKKCDVCVCNTCGKTFQHKKNILKHLTKSCNIFGIKEKKSRFCPDCNTYITLNLYRKHKMHCKPIKCYTCNVTFKTMNDWSDHQSKEHAGMSIEVETCKYCWKRCVGSVAMEKHIDKAHRPEFHMYKYLCIYCKSVFKHPQKLFGHFFTKHKEITPYTCKICDKTFRFRKRFTIHIKLAHNSVGFVEFDENYHVFFTDKKSENPFIPKSVLVDETQNNDVDETTGNVELNSDFMNATETECQTEADIKKEKPKVKRKRATKARKEPVEPVDLESSDDDESLLVVRKRVRSQKKNNSNIPLKKRRIQLANKTALTCNICNKYCYTFQNYNHHISLHSKHEVKKCIKCSKIFKSKSKLNDHIASEHSTSKLTETLKTLLEKRKSGTSFTDDLPMSVKFQRTIKKVQSEYTPTSATIATVDKKLSVQKYLENFMPDENKSDILPDVPASIKLVTGYSKEPAIKMTRFKPSIISSSQRLAMPVKFIDHFPEKAHVTIKLVESCKPDIIETNDYYSDHFDDGNIDRHESIPEVAEEVMLEGTEEVTKPHSELAHKIVIPKLPTEFTDIRIAHLLPEAPFYKIVKVKDVLKQNNEEIRRDNSYSGSFKLADGTKLVTTNPLAHLLGNNQDKVLELMKNKYYTPKNKNVQGMLAKALTKLEKPLTPSKRKKKEETKVEVTTEDK